MSSAQSNLNVKKTEQDIVIIVERDAPARYNLQIINNNNVTDKFEIYSLVGVSIAPKNLFTIGQDKNISLDIKINPHEETKKDIRGFYTFEYQIKGQNTGFFKDNLKIKIVELKDALKIEPISITPNASTAEIKITNLEKTEIKNISIKADSVFYNLEKTISLKPLEETTISVPIDLSSLSSLSAGSYDVDVTLELGGIESKLKEKVNYLEKGGVSVSQDAEGFIIRTETSTKTNEGNIPVAVEIMQTRDIFTRLFTTNSPTPTSAVRDGFFVEYLWQDEIAPSESLVVKSTTNYTFPFILIILIIIITLAVKMYIETKLVLRKRVSYVRTKGGEFALKVTLNLKAKKDLKDIEITDRIPSVMKLFDKFAIKPSEIDSKSRKLVWKLSHLNSGEDRVFTYIIYSKIKVVGNFKLPLARANYQVGDKKMTVNSNRTSFISETISN